MKKYFALTIGYKHLLVPAEASAFLGFVDQVIVCDEKGYGSEKQFLEDKDTEIGLAVVDESKIIFRETDVFDAVAKANAAADKSSKQYWELRNEFNDYKKNNPPQPVPESAATDAPAPASEPAEEFF